MTNRTEKIQVHVRPAEREKIEEFAEEEGESVSSYCQSILKRYLDDDALDKRARELEVERRLEELVALACDEIEQTATQLRDTQETAAKHNIALWELLKQDYGPAGRKDAMTTAANRLQEQLVSVGVDPDTLTPDPESETQPTTTDAASTPDTETADADDGRKSERRDTEAASATDDSDDDSSWKTWENDTDATDEKGAADDRDDGDWKTWKDDDGDNNDDTADDSDDDDDDVYIDRDWDI